MPTYKHKESGEVKTFSRIRIYPESGRVIDLTTGEDIGKDWELDQATDYKTVAAKKAPGDKKTTRA